MLDHMDGVMRALDTKKTEWKEDLYFPVKVARQKLSTYHAEVTPTTSLLLMSAHILDPFRNVRSFSRLDKAIDINPKDETSYTTHYQEAILKYLENEYWGKHRWMYITKHENVPHGNIFRWAQASGFGQSSFDPYDLSSDDEDYVTTRSMAEMTPGRSDHAACLLAAARLHLNSPPEAPKNWGQINPNHNDYQTGPMEISSTFWLRDITGWWRQQQEAHSKYANLSNVARDTLSIIPHGVRVQASISLGRDVIGWGQSKTAGETLRENVVVRQFAPATNRILAGDCAASDNRDTENDLESKKEAEQRKLHRMPKVHDFLEMWQGSQTLFATQKESQAQNKQTTAVESISDIDEIIKAFWSNFHHDGVAAFTLSERSPLPPALSAKDLPGGRIQALTVCKIKWIDHHPAETDDHSAPETPSDTAHWLIRNGDLDNPNDSNENCEANNKSGIEPDNGIKALGSPKHWVVSATPNVLGLIRPTRRSMTMAEKGLKTVSAMENGGIRETRKK